MTTYNSVSNGSKHKQLYKCGWLWQTGYYAKTKRKGGRGMREGWEYICFESCLNKIPKAKQVTTKEYNSGTKYPIISQEDKLISGYCDDESLLFHVDKPVIIFGDHTRVLKYIDFDFVVGADGVKIISPKENLNAKFLLYFLTWYNIPNLGYSRHYKLLKELDIPVPPLSTQFSIVSELDKINELISLKKEQLKDYDKLAQSIFYEMFGDPVVNEKGWEVDYLSHLCNVFAGGDKPSDLSEMQSKEFPYPVIANGDGDKGILGYSKMCKIKEDAVTIGARGASIGNCRLVRNGFTPAIRLITLVPQMKLDCNYLYYYVRNMNYRVNGVAQAQLTVPNVQREIIPIPPLPLQQLFAQRIELIEKQKAEIQRTISDLETLLAARMQYWFD